MVTALGLVAMTRFLLSVVTGGSEVSGPAGEGAAAGEWGVAAPAASAVTDAWQPKSASAATTTAWQRSMPAMLLGVGDIVNRRPRGRLCGFAICFVPCGMKTTASDTFERHSSRALEIGALNDTSDWEFTWHDACDLRA